jgi:basic amino acid/polyamine antiporter, APA family
MVANAESPLIRGIGRWGLTAFALNLTVGSGILGLPARLQTLVGNYSTIVIGCCGLLIILVALCFAEISSRFERTGGPQLYTTLAFGPLIGFTVGWLLWISRLGTCAAVSNLMVDYGQVLLPALGRPTGRGIFITAMIAAYAWINIRGIRQTVGVSTVFSLAKLIPLFAIAIAGMFFIDPQAVRPGAPPSSSDLSAAILLAAFAFFGFDSATILAGEVENPRRSVPFAIFLSVGIVTTLYTLIQIVCVGTLPNLATSDRPIADVAATIAGPWASAAVAIMAVIACAGVYGASITPATRLLFAMGEHEQLPATLARTHPRLRTPVSSIVISSVAALALALSGSFIYAVKITLIARMIVYALSCLSLPIFRGRNDVPAAGFTLPGGSWIALAATFLCVAFLARSSMHELLDVGVGAIAGLAIWGATRLAKR